jgi:hypothetical protein
MRRLLLTASMTMAWLLASPSLRLPDSHWLEVGAPPAMAQEFKGIMAEEPGSAAKPSQKKSTKKAQPRKRVGSSGLVISNQPPKYPMRQIDPPQTPNVTGTVITPERDPRYPDVPTVPIIPRGATGGAGAETSQDRVVRCTHQGNLGGLSPGQQGAYINNCAF